MALQEQTEYPISRFKGQATSEGTLVLSILLGETSLEVAVKLDAEFQFPDVLTGTCKFNKKVYKVIVTLDSKNRPIDFMYFSRPTR